MPQAVPAQQMQHHDVLRRTHPGVPQHRLRKTKAPSPSRSGRPRAIAVDGKALKGSARLTATRRHHAAPRAIAILRNLAIGVLITLGADNIANTARAIRDEPRRALPILGLTDDPDTYGT